MHSDHPARHGANLPARLLPPVLRRFLCRFLRAEDGALIPLALQIFLIMMICTGISIDLVRQEELRSRVQNALDRATLAAASLSQDLPPADVVRDYMDKAGLGHLGITPVIEEGPNREWRRVTVSAQDGLATIFGPLLGIDSLAARAASRAEESIGNVEISLVLDISGSMNFNIETGVSGVSPTRMDLLRPAALTFVRRMFENVQPEGAQPGRLSISVVPYNQQVTLGSQTAAAFTLGNDHNLNTCADVQTLPANQIAINPDSALQRTMYGDSFDYWGQEALGQGVWGLVAWAANGVSNCQEAPAAAVLAFNNNLERIEARINGLTPGGDTAIDIGARWGLALLDPAAGPALDRLVAAGQTGAELAGRPLPYRSAAGSDRTETMKVLVLMTDGQNTRSYSTRTGYRTGDSGFRSTRSATAFGTATDEWNALYYYVPGRTRPYYSLRNGAWYRASDISGTLSNISWQTVWSKGYTLQFMIDRFLLAPMRAHDGAVTRTGLYADMAVQSEFSQKDAALRSLCATAKDAEHGVRIFTVAVDAPPEGVAILQDCATDAGYAYNVTANGLTEAFASIASSITALRLTH